MPQGIDALVECYLRGCAMMLTSPRFIEQGDIGGAGQVWLKEGLQSLAENLQSYGSDPWTKLGSDPLVTNHLLGGSSHLVSG